MPERKFFIVDVFADQKFGGNQLAVFLDGNQYSDDVKQKMAREMNFSETTFIMSDREQTGTWPVRIFTPNEEVPFAGHPTIGTAYIIQKYLIESPVDKIILAEKAGDIPVSISYRNNVPDILTMTQLSPKFGEEIGISAIAAILQLDEEQFDERYPIESVSTGLAALMIPLKTLEAVKGARINRDRYFDFCKKHDTKNLFVFAPETYDSANQINARMFAEYFGVPEDPATGSANGCLAGYLVKHRYFGGAEIDIRVEQGYEIGRPSILYLTASKDKNSYTIKVGGRVNLFAQGNTA